MSSRLRIGVIGAGFIAQVAHLKAFHQMANAQIVAIADPRMNQCREVAAQFDARPLIHHAQLLEDATVDAVVICVYRRCQAPLARAALAAGKHVFSEKPMAYSLAEGEQLAQAIEQAGRHYALGYMKRFDAGVQEFRRVLQDVLQSGDMGELLYVNLRDFCPTYGVALPPHIRLNEKSAYHYEASPYPMSLREEQHADFDYTLNVIGHDLNLLHYLFGPVFRPERFAVKAGAFQSATLAGSGFEVALTAGRSDHGKWDQTLEVGFRSGRMLLKLASPLDEGKSAGYIIERPQGTFEGGVPAGKPGAFVAQAARFTQTCLGDATSDISLDTLAKNGLCDLALVEKLWEKVTWTR